MERGRTVLHFPPSLFSLQLRSHRYLADSGWLYQTEPHSWNCSIRTSRHSKLLVTMWLKKTHFRSYFSTRVQ